MSGWREFVALFEALDETTSLNGKRAALERYFRGADPADAAWAIYFLTGRKVKRAVAGARLREWASGHCGLSPWLVEESYHAVGDLGETLAILCSRGPGAPEDESVAGLTLRDFVERELVPLPRLSEAEQRAIVTRWWRIFDERSCFVALKLLTGSFRVGVSATIVAKALATVAGRDSASIEHRLMGSWEATPGFVQRLTGEDDGREERSRPYPFYLASPIATNATEELPEASPPSAPAAGPLASLGTPNEWLIEWKWDGIRAQLLVRQGDVFLWSRGEELVTDRFPEIVAAARALPDGTVLDGEIVPWAGDRPLPFAVLQTRIGRKNLSARALRDAPVILLAFDVLEHEGADVRGESLERRRSLLERTVAGDGTIRRSPTIDVPSWDDVSALQIESRARGVEGVMIKRRSSPYRVGRPRGDWWKWKIEPYTVDAVLVYAQAGHGRRASLYTDYTFAVWDGDVLVPVAKAYSGLTDREILSLDAWIRANTTDRFGPVRAVTPHHLFELGFEGIQRSTRHKSGIAVRFPRMLRWRTDKMPRDGATIQELRALITDGDAEKAARAPREDDATPTLFDDPNAPAPDE